MCAYDEYIFAFAKVDVTGYLRASQQITGYSYPPEGVPFTENRTGPLFLVYL